MLDSHNLVARLERSAECAWRSSHEGHASWCIQQARNLIEEGQPQLALRYLDRAEAELARAQSYPGLSKEELGHLASGGRAV